MVCMALVAGNVLCAMTQVSSLCQCVGSHCFSHMRQPLTWLDDGVSTTGLPDLRLRNTPSEIMAVCMLTKDTVATNTRNAFYPLNSIRLSSYAFLEAKYVSFTSVTVIAVLFWSFLITLPYLFQIKRPTSKSSADKLLKGVSQQFAWRGEKQYYMSWEACAKVL